MSGWNGPIGPVTMENSHGVLRVFPTLSEAIRSVRYGQFTEIFAEPAAAAPRNPYLGEPLRLRDECGMIIPLWRIEQEAQGYTPPYRPWRRIFYNPERDFRNGPVPLTGGRCGGHVYRRIRTRGEIRDLAGLEAELREEEEIPVRLKIRTRRRRLPTAWDDQIIRGKGRGWKHHRRTQWK